VGVEYQKTLQSRSEIGSRKVRSLPSSVVGPDGDLENASQAKDLVL